MDKIDRSEILVVFFIAFLLGVLLADLFFAGNFDKLGFILLLMAIFIKRFLFVDWKIFLIIFCGVFLAFIRLYFANLISEKDVSNFSGKVVLRGCVVDQVDVRTDKVKYTVGAVEVEIGEEKSEVNGRVLISGPRTPVYEYGDCFLVSGKLEKPGIINNFDYGKYLGRYGIYAVIYRAKIEKIAQVEDFFSRGFYWLFHFRSIFEHKISQLYDEPYAGFMAGLILGSRRGISDELTQQFNTTGLSHIVAISGYNITMLITVVSAIFGFLGRKRKIIVAAVIIFIFVILVGASASVVRAAIMGMVGLLALWCGRNYFVSVSLFLAGFLMNLFNPLILLNDVGFQLSFLATCGLVYVSPLIKNFFVKVPQFFGMRESLTMTISAQILALPIILLNFGRLSLIAPLANILVLPFVPTAMFFGFFAVFFSFFWNFLGGFFGFLGYLIMALMVLLVQFFAAVPFASLQVDWFNFWWAGIYYFLVVWWILRKNRK
ncbi:ComEC/Rec2 family competence protein [Candidatus Peregrinibacteria bacterium]|nr:ComEC/Rec2 family competence protein [Candidatus Peregrinibacteria bacterium]